MDPRTMFLTGCASGMGRHLTGALARAGHRIVATDVNGPALARAALEERWPAERVTLNTLDVACAAQWGPALTTAARLLDGIDVVMNIAGVMRPDWLLDVDPAWVDRMVDINLKGVIHGTAAAARHMSERGRGHIVNIASMSALAPIPGLSVYCATKYGVRGFSLAAAYELRRKNIYVTTVCPDPVQTPMLRDMSRHEAAAMAFSGSSLTLADIERLVLGRVLRRRPLEVGAPRLQSGLVRIANLFTVLGLWMTPRYIRVGLKRLRSRAT